MPRMTYRPQYDRHLTYQALGRCPRLYQFYDLVRLGVLPESVPSDSLALGIAVHHGLAELWRQRFAGPTQTWDVPRALTVMRELSRQDFDPGRHAVLTTAEQAVHQYAEHWSDIRQWEVLAVNPGEFETPWCVLADNTFLAYPDLIVRHPEIGVLVIDHKTGKYGYRQTDWAQDPQQLTQCLAAQQAWPDEPVHWMIDYLQRPGRNSTIWSFPATPMTLFDSMCRRRAVEWLELNKIRRHFYQDRAAEYIRLGPGGQAIEPWPRDSAQCHGRYGLCDAYVWCFGVDEKEEES